MPATFSRKLFVAALLLLLATGAIAYFGTGTGAPDNKYKTQAADIGDISQSISANGTLNPVVLVNVGTQVSGTVQKLHADFNSNVQAGQVLTELDPALFQAQVRQGEANLLSAEASLKLAENKLSRTRQLQQKGFVSGAEVDQAEQQLDAAKAQVAVAGAQLVRDRANLDYTVIRSPISGVVVARNVDVGQTVAASFQTPTLFQIAKDLRRMQIDTSVAEADIGQLRTGMEVKFSVDAFLDREFSGSVKQVRLNPAIQQNVVTYNVVLAVSNEAGELLPGMTAHVRFAINQKKQVLRVPNAALRFKPAGGARGGKTPAVYRLENGKITPVSVKTGIADNSFTEIADGDIKAGDKLVVRETGDKEKSPSAFRIRLF